MGRFSRAFVAVCCASALGLTQCTDASEESAKLASELGPSLPGFADLHLHLLAEEAFGGGWLHGPHSTPGSSCDGGLPPSDHARVKQDLSELSRSCPLPATLSANPIGAAIANNAGAVLSEEIGKTEGSQGDTGIHLERRRLDAGWPSWDTIAHHQAPIERLRQAHQRGLSLIVLSAVSFDWLCRLTPEQNRTRPQCDEMADVEAQIRLARALDAQHAWFEIVLSPGQARSAIQAGRLAVVLSIEASHLFGSPGTPWQPELQRFYDLGVRTLQPVHQLDNRFGGAALHEPIFQIAQYTENCHVDFDCGVTTDTFTLGFDVERNARGECRNVRGLSAEGRDLVTALMDRGMLIDIAHLSEKSLVDTYALAELRDFYPLYASHGHFREIMAPAAASAEKTTPAWAIELVRRTGGMFGLRTFHEETRAYGRSSVAANCQGSSRSFAQANDFGRLGLKVDVAFGSDLNGFIQQTRPRFGPDACSATKWDRGLTLGPFEAQADCEARAQRELGPGRLGSEFDEQGLAHIGLLPDLLLDLKRLGARTDAIESSTETFVRMWERAFGPRTGPAQSTADLDASAVGGFVSRELRESSYPAICNEHYCPGHQILGGECRFDAECTTGKCGSTAACGLPEGVCVCDDDADCGATDFCELDVPLVAADNACRPKRADHEPCSADRMCRSGACGGCATLVGWCYTPSSKSYDQACRADRECRSNRCSADCILNPAGRCLCTSHSDCAGHQFCGWGANSGNCVNKRGRGQACLNAFECSSGSCRVTITGPRCR